MIVNGYEIPECNFGDGDERKYRICACSGNVLHVVDGSMRNAVAKAESMKPGVVPKIVEPKPEAIPKPKRTAKPKPKK